MFVSFSFRRWYVLHSRFENRYQAICWRQAPSFFLGGGCALPAVRFQNNSQPSFLVAGVISFFLQNRNTKPHSQYYLFIVGPLLLSGWQCSPLFVPADVIQCFCVGCPLGVLSSSSFWERQSNLSVSGARSTEKRVRGTDSANCVVLRVEDRTPGEKRASRAEDTRFFKPHAPPVSVCVTT